MKPEDQCSPDMQPAAIIGMGCFFPKSPGLKAFWRLIYNGTNAVTDVPPTHWPVDDYFDADPTRPDHTYCKRGGFLPQILFDPTEFGIPPNSLEATDTSQLLGLMAAKAALADAGYVDDRTFDRSRTSVILGVTGTQELVIPLGARLGFPLWRRALESAGVANETVERVVAAIADAYVPWQENSFPGLLGNVVAGRISNRLDLGGTNCVVDAACASSMSAVHLALLELASGRSDMVVTGGVDTLNDIFMHMCFAKTRILSPTGEARPFSKDADGTVLGEGIGLLVIKRLAQAVEDEDRIYAVIRGIGSSSDGKSQSIYAPRPEGQAAALQKAYQNAGIDPATVELIEAHGTGTRVGDMVEFTALRRVFERSGARKNHCAIGSIKSMIGHTKAAAGAAGLIKSVLALHHKVLPPTLNVQHPDPKLDIQNSPFYINTASRPWLSDNAQSRRCGVSAFGFGGSNFHLVLEEYRPDKSDVAWDGSVEIAALSADSRDGLVDKLGHLSHRLENGTPLAEVAADSRREFVQRESCRLLLTFDAAEDGNLQAPSTWRDTIAQGRNVLRSAPDATVVADRTRAFFGQGPPPGKLAFLFPGQGSQYPGMGRDLVCRFPEAFKIVQTACHRFGRGKNLGEIIYPPPSITPQDTDRAKTDLRRTDRAQPAIGAVSLAMLKVLNAFGVRADATAGHSFGELTALHAAGWIDEEAFLSLALLRGRLMAAAGQSQTVPPSGMLAVKAPLADIEKLIISAPLDVVLANRNAPNQGVVAGSQEALATAQRVFREQGFTSTPLPVAAAFHSRFMTAARQPFKEALQTIVFTPTQTPVFSNATGLPYPGDPASAAAQLGDQLRNPVDFLGDIQNMFESGVRTFLEIGPRKILAGLTSAILEGKDCQVLALDASAGNGTGLDDLAVALCRLAAAGHHVDISRWEDPTRPLRKPLMQVALTGANYRKPRQVDRVRRPAAPEGQSSSLQPPAVKTEAPPKAVAPFPWTEARPDTIESPNPMKDTPEQPQPHWYSEAFSVLQRGLESIQSLQLQTAEAHQKFLDSQQEASHTLQAMMEHTRRLAEMSMGANSVQPPSFDRRPQHPPVDPTRGFAASKTSESGSDQQAVPDAPSGLPESETPKGADAGLQDHPESGGSGTESIVDAGIEDALLAVVADLTGYPMDMIGLDMDIEADLGIDSIKRVEIFSALEEKIPHLPTISPDTMGRMKSLRQVLGLFGAKKSGTMPPSGVLPPSTKKASDAKADPKTPDGDQGALMADLLAVVSELTGYPVDTIDLDMDIEADLGIDSIKRVEIFSALEEKRPGLPAVSPDQMARLKTLGQIAAYLKDTASDAPLPLAREETPEDAPNEAAPPVPSNTAVRRPLRRRIVAVVENRATDRTEILIPQGRKVFITEDGSGLSAAVADEMGRRNINTVLISPDILNYKKSLPPAGGLVLILPPGVKTSSADLKELFRLTARLAPDLADSAAGGGAVFAAVTRLDGAFGFNGIDIADPLQGALAALVKTAAAEWETVHCRAIDVAPSWQEAKAAAAAVVKELLSYSPADPIEIGFAEGRRCVLELEEAPLSDSVMNPLALDTRDVVVVTGGARGITAAAAVALAAESRPMLVLMGRSPGPQPEPEWLRHISDEAAMKRAILDHVFDGKGTPAQLESAFRQYAAGREISKTLSDIKESGGDAVYISVDIREAAAVRRSLEDVRGKYGPIKAILHGAGVLEDRLIRDKTPEQFENVFGTKVQGLENLLEATRSDSLHHVVLFSSVTARLGNRGQADYAMANEALNKIAQQMAFRRPDCRIVSLNWGPWDGGMVTPSLKREFKRRGIELISSESGARHLVDEMRISGKRPVEVVVGGGLAVAAKQDTVPATADPAPHPAAVDSAEMILSFQRDLDLGSHPVLRSHVIGGKPVVPLALMTEWFGHGALHENPGLLLQGLDDIRVLKGIRIERQTKHVRVLAGKARRKDGTYEVPVELRDGFHGKIEIVHSKAKAILVEELATPPEYRVPQTLTRHPYKRTVPEVYEKILFHGPDLHGIREITHLSADGMIAWVAAAPEPSKWLKDPLRNQWLSDPLALDAAFQMATIWCYEEMGAVSLPTYCAALRLYRQRFPTQGVQAVLEIANANRHKMSGTVTFLDAEGAVVARISGYEAVMNQDLYRAFKPAAA